MNSIKHDMRENVLLLLPACNNEKSFQYFKSAMTTAFDINFKNGNNTINLMNDICKRDLLKLPMFPDHKYNYYQIASLSDYNEPILDILHYLFKSYEPYFDESYHFNFYEKLSRIEFYKYIVHKYENANQYINRIKTILFLDNTYNLDEWIKYIQFNVFDNDLYNTKNNNINILDKKNIVNHLLTEIDLKNNETEWNIVETQNNNQEPSSTCNIM